MKAIVASLGLLMIAAPAVGQQDRAFPNEQLATGTRFLVQAETPGRSEARDMQKRVARCTVYRNKKLARAMLANSNTVSVDFDAIDADAQTLLEKLDAASCISRAMKGMTYKMQMRLTYPTLRALMVEEVYLMDNDGPVQLAADAGPSVDARPGGLATNARATAMATLSDCIVYNDIGGSDALLRTTIASEAEQASILALEPALTACGMAGSGEVVLDPSMLRQVVADGLWVRSYYEPVARVKDDSDA